MWYTKVPVITIYHLNINTLVLYCTVGIGEREKFTVYLHTCKLPVPSVHFRDEDDVERESKTRPVKKSVR